MVDTDTMMKILRGDVPAPPQQPNPVNPPPFMPPPNIPIQPGQPPPFPNGPPPFPMGPPPFPMGPMGPPPPMGNPTPLPPQFQMPNPMMNPMMMNQMMMQPMPPQLINPMMAQQQQQQPQQPPPQIQIPGVASISPPLAGLPSSFPGVATISAAAIGAQPLPIPKLPETSTGGPSSVIPSYAGFNLRANPNGLGPPVVNITPGGDGPASVRVPGLGGDMIPWGWN